MNYLDSNLKCLKKNIKDEEIYEKVVNIIEKKEYSFGKFKIGYAKNGQKIVEINNGNQYIRLNSEYNPKLEAQRWVKKLKFDNLDAPVLMFGIANGVFAREVLNNLRRESVAILVEPDISLFIFCLQEFDMIDIISDERVRFFVDGINLDKFSNALNSHITVKMLNMQIVCAHPKMDELYYDKSVEFVKAIRKRFAKCNSDLATYHVLAENIMKNIFLNLRFIRESNHISEFKERIPSDIPFIIVAAGPSLDKNIDELKRAQGKAFIMATDRAVGCLVNHNIKFDAIITLDSRKDTSDIGINPERYGDYPIFAGIDSSNELLELNRGRKILLNTTNFFVTLYYQHNIDIELFSVGGSVATAAFNVARIIGSKRIVLVGQDLAYNGKVTHAGGIAENVPYQECDDYVEGIDGSRLKTRLDWLRYLNWYENAIKELEPDIEVIDATEGGAKIKGTIIMKLSEVIDNYCCKEFNFESLLSNMSPTFSEKKYLEVKYDLLHLERELNIIEECLKKAKDASDNLLNICEKDVIGDEDINEQKSCCGIIKNMNEIIEGQLVYSIIKQYIEKDVNVVMRGINYIFEDKKENLKDSCNISKFVYERISDAVKSIRPNLDKALKNI